MDDNQSGRRIDCRDEEDKSRHLREQEDRLKTYPTGMESIRWRHLPHWDVPGQPTSSLRAWREAFLPRACWISNASGSASRSNGSRRGYRSRSGSCGAGSRFLPRCDEWLDLRPAARHLSDPALAKEVVDALYFFAGQRYDLLAFCVMPSHVHWVFTPLCRIGLQPVEERRGIAAEADGGLEAWFAEDEDDRLKTYPGDDRLKTYPTGGGQEANVRRESGSYTASNAIRQGSAICSWDCGARSGSKSPTTTGPAMRTNWSESSITWNRTQSRRAWQPSPKTGSSRRRATG